MRRGVLAWLWPRAAGDAPWSATATDEEAREYVQGRLDLFSKITALSSGAFLASVLGMYQLYPHLRPARHELVHACAIGGVVILLALWLGLLRRRPLSLRALYAIDTFYMAALGAMLGISAYFSPEQRQAVYGAFIWESLMVYSRVLIVPSTARRTLVVTSLSFLPLATASVLSAIYQPQYLEMPPVITVIAVWWLVAWAVAIATNGSRVIYGLRREATARQFGQYTRGEMVKSGGMGEVYRARHAMLRRPTALKLLKPERIGAANLRRFEREVQLTAQLTHPNTVAIYDYGRTPDGVFYYAMELLDGIDLEVLVREDGPQSPGRVVHILRQLCGALDEAHALGLIHRDVKPGNILLCLRGRTPDVAKIVDFGLVKDLRPEGAQADGLRVEGTPAYISPEAASDPERVGPHSDLYGLGAVAYFLLTGERLFDDADSATLLRKHACTAPPPPSSRTVLPIPAQLEALVLRCLAKAPAERPASARALAAELDALTDVPAWDEDAAMAWWQARPTAAPGQRFAESSQTVTIDVDLQGRSDPPASATQDMRVQAAMVTTVDSAPGSSQDGLTGQAMK